MQIADAKEGSAYVPFFTHHVVDDIIAVDRTLIENQDRHRHDAQDDRGKTEIE